MAFSINELSQGLRFGGARPTLFDVQITFTQNQVETVFNIQTAQLPESTLGVIEVPYFGRKIKLAGDRTFAEWTVTVLNDEDFAIRNSLEVWSQQINTHAGNTYEYGLSPSAYRQRAIIRQYSKSGCDAPLKTYIFENLFPTSVGPITMGWDQNDQIETFDVSFQYDYWVAAGGGVAIT